MHIDAPHSKRMPAMSTRKASWTVHQAACISLPLRRRAALVSAGGSLGAAALAAGGIIAASALAANAGVLGGGGGDNPRALVRSGMDKFRKVCLHLLFCVLRG